MATNTSVPAVTIEVLAKLEAHVDGRPVLYATKFARPEERLRGTSTVAVARFAFDAALKSASRAIATGIPTDGWLIATPAGIHIFKKTTFGGVGKELGTLTSAAIAGVAVAHGRKSAQTKITITMVDESSATMFVRTAETYPALSPWIRGASIARSADDTLDERLPPVPEAPVFDADHLLQTINGS